MLDEKYVPGISPQFQREFQKANPPIVVNNNKINISYRRITVNTAQKTHHNTIINSKKNITKPKKQLARSTKITSARVLA